MKQHVTEICSIWPSYVQTKSVGPKVPGLYPNPMNKTCNYNVVVQLNQRAKDEH